MIERSTAQADQSSGRVRRRWGTDSDYGEIILGRDGKDVYPMSL